MYIHTHIDKYQEQLNSLDVIISKKIKTSKREAEFLKLKPQIEKEFKQYKGTFLMIKEENIFEIKPEIILCFNGFMVDYYHNAWLSRIRVSVLDVFSKKFIDVSTNCEVIYKYDKDVSLMTILQDIRIIQGIEFAK